MKTIAIIDDDFTLGEILEKRINDSSAFNSLGAFLGPISFLEAQVKVDFILLDITMGEMNGIDAIPLILAKYPNTQIVMNSIIDDTEVILKALQLGAVGYIDKQSTDIDIINGVHTISKGGAYMTPAIARKVVNYFGQRSNLLEDLTNREKEVAKGVLDGLSYKLIADKLHISIDTVRMHIKKIYRKLNINSKSELFHFINK